MDLYLALDPGESTGWALFGFDGKPVQMGTVAYAQLWSGLLSKWNPAFYVVEQFKVRTSRNRTAKHYTQEWDPAVTARAIGKIELAAEQNNKPVHFQQPDIIQAAGPMLGIKTEGFRSAQHSIDAILHGWWYAHKHWGVMPLVENPISAAPPPEPTKITQVSGLGDIAKLTRQKRRR